MSSIDTRYTATQDLAEQYKAQHREKEALQAEHEVEMTNLKRSYNEEKADTEDRFEQSSQAERLAHYEHLRNLKSQINREERTLEMQGRQEIHGKKAALKQEEIQTDLDGRSKVDGARKRYAAAVEYERQKQQSTQESLRDDYNRNTGRILSENEKSVEKLRTQKEQYLESQKAAHAAALDSIEQHYQDIRENHEQRYVGELASLENRSINDLNDRKLANASKIARYEEKSADPFYQIKKYDSDLLDIGESFVLRVKVPDHERKNLRVQISGNDLQLVGQRSSDERALTPDGRTLSTRSHQTISEKFTLSSPVDSKGMQVEHQDEWVQYTIPKFGPAHPRSNPNSANLTELEQNPIAKELGFAQNLPRPSVLNRQSGKGTLT
jgi:HSP20 family molecular chaperone IbpA